MTISKQDEQIHPVLLALGLPLPMADDTSWTLTQLDAPGCAMRCRITLTDGDLAIELPDTAGHIERYIFNKESCLVSLSHDRYFSGVLFEKLTHQVLDAIRMRCGCT